MPVVGGRGHPGCRTRICPRALVSPDGRHFLAVKKPDAGKQQDALMVVWHWFDELKARVPTK